MSKSRRNQLNTSDGFESEDSSLPSIVVSDNDTDTDSDNDNFDVSRAFSFIETVDNENISSEARRPGVPGTRGAGFNKTTSSDDDSVASNGSESKHETNSHDDEDSSEAEFERMPRTNGQTWRDEMEATRLPVKHVDGRVVSLAAAHTAELLQQRQTQTRDHLYTQNDMMTRDDTNAPIVGARVDLHAMRILQQNRKNHKDEKKIAESSTQQQSKHPQGDQNSAKSSSLFETAGLKQTKQIRMQKILRNASLEGLSVVEILQRREHRKVMIAELAQRIVENPEKSISASAPANEDVFAARAPLKRKNRLLQLHEMALDGDIVLRKLALLSELAVFKDIIPGYKIRLATAEEQSVKVKKDVKKLREFERDLLTSYQRFLQDLETTARLFDSAEQMAAKAINTAEKTPVHSSAISLSSRKADERRRANDAITAVKLNFGGDASATRSLAVVAIKCMCELLVAHPHFNFRSNLLISLIPRGNHRSDLIARPIVTALAEMFREDKTSGAASEEAVALLYKLVVKKEGVKSRDDLLSCLLELPLHTLPKDNRQQLQERKRIKTALAKRGKREDAQEIIAGVKAADAENRDERIQHQTACLRHVMLILLRILRSDNNAHLLPIVLSGLGKFSHLVDVQLVEDVVFHLRRVAVYDSDINDAVDELLATSLAAEVEAESHMTMTTTPDVDKTRTAIKAQEKVERALEGNKVLPVNAALNLVHTALKIIHGPHSEVVNIDDTVFASYAYRILLRLLAPAPAKMNGSNHIPEAIRMLQLLLCTHKTIDPARVSAFAARCINISLHMPPNACLSLMSFTRTLLQRHTPVKALLNSLAEEKVGSGEHIPGGLELDDAGGLTATAWPLALLGRHYNPAVRAFALGTSTGNPALPKSSWDKLYEQFDTSLGELRPAIDAPRRHPLATAASQTSELNDKDDDNFLTYKLATSLDPLSYELDTAQGDENEKPVQLWRNKKSKSLAYIRPNENEVDCKPAYLQNWLASCTTNDTLDKNAFNFTNANTPKRSKRKKTTAGSKSKRSRGS